MPRSEKHKKRLSGTFVWRIVYGLALLMFTGYTLFDTFVIPKVGSVEVTSGGIYAQVQTEAAPALSEDSDSEFGSEDEIRTIIELDSEKEIHQDEDLPSKGDHLSDSSALDTDTTDTEVSRDEAKNSLLIGDGDEISAADGDVSISAADSDGTFEGESSSGSSATSVQASMVISYSDAEYYYFQDGITIAIDKIRYADTTVYIAEAIIESLISLKSAFAQDVYGRNIKDTTSNIASDNGAILAINGDYYGFRDYGYVIRNGILYRDIYDDRDDTCFVLYEDGSMETVVESSTTGQQLIDCGAVQAWSFGPPLIENGEISVGKEEEVSRSTSSNPRTAIGEIAPLHYLFVVSEGRTSENAGLSLYELACVMSSYSAISAYNLDGGGSTTLYFNGEVLNRVVGGRGGHGTSERSVSDIIYIG